MATDTGDQLALIARELFELVTHITMAALRGRRRSEDLKELEFLTLTILQDQGTMIVGDIQRLLGVLPAQMSRIIRALENGDKPLIACRINSSDSARSTCASRNPARRPSWNTRTYAWHASASCSVTCATRTRKICFASWRN